MSLLSILFLLSGLCYASAFLSAAAALKKSKPSLGRGFHALALSGLCLQTLALGIRTAEIGALPLSNPFEVIETIAWLFVVFDIAAAGVLKIRLAGFFTMLPAAVLTLLPIFCPHFEPYMASPARAASLWGELHAWLAMLSYACMFLAALFSSMDLMQRRALKKKSNAAVDKMLLPLPMLERYIKACTYAAAALMGVSLAVGAVSALNINLDSYTLIKFAAGGALFIMQTLFAVMILRGTMSAAPMSKAAVILFIAAILLLIPIELRSFLS